MLSAGVTRPLCRSGEPELLSLPTSGPPAVKGQDALRSAALLYSCVLVENSLLPAAGEKIPGKEMWGNMCPEQLTFGFAIYAVPESILLSGTTRCCVTSSGC